MLKSGIDLVLMFYSCLHGIGGYVVFYLISIAFACAYITKGTGNKVLIDYAIVAIIIIYNPIVAFFVDKIFGIGVYYMMLWSLPVALSITCMFTQMLFFTEKRWKKIIGFIMISCLLFYGGKCLYYNDVFVNSENIYKYADVQKDVLDYILEDKETDKVKVFFMPEINKIARSYSTSFLLGYYQKENGDFEGSYDALTYINETYEYDKVADYLVDNNFNYFVWYNENMNFAKDKRIDKIYSENGYQIYKINQ